MDNLFIKSFLTFYKNKKVYTQRGKVNRIYIAALKKQKNRRPNIILKLLY